MNAKILAVANQKGGVGKTTTSLNLGGALARQGKKVLLLDLDPHACATLNARIYPEDMGLSLHDIFLAREEDWPVLWPQVTHVDALEGMDVAPGNIRLSELEVDFRERRGKGGVLARSLAEQRRNYDFIVLDCPPHVGILLVNALVAADLLIIPIQTDFLALHGLKLLFDTLHTLRRALGCFLLAAVPLGAVVILFSDPISVYLHQGAGAYAEQNGWSAVFHHHRGGHAFSRGQRPRLHHLRR